ncbi:AIM24 family protein [Spirillospora sp. NPDC047279]|uniref:AIM24 family protein n=1 Tax=Spirillospora sp. NPDC047279 TaxID=3155478 RepID=UPI0033E40D6A
MLRSSFFNNMEQGQTPGHFVLQNSKMLRIHLNGEALARQGSMVAFQGQMEFDYEGSGGMGKFLKKALTGEGVPLMRVRGQGLLFVANDADDIHLFYLENDGITVNGSNILAFDPTLQSDIQRVQGAGIAAGGLFNTTLTGTGWVALTSHGTPVMLDAGRAPTFADGQSAVAWSTSLQVGVNKTFKAGALIGRGSGEAMQLAYQGQGFVLVQASEGPTVPHHTH